MHYPDISVALF